MREYQKKFEEKQRGDEGTHGEEKLDLFGVNRRPSGLIELIGRGAPCRNGKETRES